MHVVLQIAEGWLDLNAPDVGLAERRPVTAADQERCNAWATQYRRLLGRDGAEARLVALGREMYAWLDGETRWLERLLADAMPLVLEFQARRGQTRWRRPCCRRHGSYLPMRRLSRW